MHKLQLGADLHAHAPGPGENMLTQRDICGVFILNGEMKSMVRSSGNEGSILQGQHEFR